MSFLQPFCVHSSWPELAWDVFDSIEPRAVLGLLSTTVRSAIPSNSARCCVLDLRPTYTATRFRVENIGECLEIHDSDSTRDSVARGATSGSASSRTPHFRASHWQPQRSSNEDADQGSGHKAPLHQRIQGVKRQGLLAKASTVANSYSLGSNKTFAALAPAQGHGWAGIPCVYLCVCFVSLAWLRYCASMLL